MPEKTTFSKPRIVDLDADKDADNNRPVTRSGGADGGSPGLAMVSIQCPICERQLTAPADASLDEVRVRVRVWVRGRVRVRDCPADSSRDQVKGSQLFNLRVQCGGPLTARG